MDQGHLVLEDLKPFFPEGQVPSKYATLQNLEAR